jgi:uncharacterized protein YndB with AHSA1/START domain
MPTVEESVLIPRPPQEVFDYVSAAENLPVWDSSILKAQQADSGPLRVGTRWRGVSKVLGRRFKWTTELVELEPPTRTVSRSVEGKLSFTVTNTFQPEAGGTRFTYKVDAESGLGGVFGRVGDPIVEKAQRRTVRANLDTLAELLADSHA